MELKAIEQSRIVFLTHLRRPAGPVFIPIAVQMFVDRYQFQKVPEGEELLADVVSFRHGLYNGVAIGEFNLYRDGIIVSSPATTDILDAFLDDFLAWARSEVGVIQTDIPPLERHYESAIIVTMDVNLEAAFAWAKGVEATLRECQLSYGLPEFRFEAGALSLAVDETTKTGRKPIPFSVARRVGVPFEKNFYFATAPLRTRDHLAVLTTMEDTLRQSFLSDQRA